MDNTDVIDRLEERLDNLSVSGMFIGRSVVPGNKRFVTLRGLAGQTIATGKGENCLGAIKDALDNTTKRKMPGVG